MIEILYQDTSVLVINKPAGLITIPDGYNPMLPHIRSLLEPEYGRIWIVHRLDKETSGVLLLARNEMVHSSLNQQFSERKIVKEYLALVVGKFPDSLECNQPLKVNGDRRHRTVVDFIDGKPASTTYKLENQFENDCSLIHAFPHTGYTHQIRAHAWYAGFPLVADLLYYSAESKQISAMLPIKRTALHAASITFCLPKESNAITVTAPLPDDFISTTNFLTTKGASK